MDRTQGENYTIVDGKRQFTDGPPGTCVEEDWLNSIQEELMTCIVNAGITPNSTNYAQLYEAILAYALTRGAYFRCQYDPMSALQMGLAPASSREVNVDIEQASETIIYFRGYVYVSCTGANVIKKINVLNNSISTWTGFNTPHGMCFDGTDLWVAQRIPGTVVKVDISNGSILETYAIGGNPQGVCYGLGSIWTGHDGGNYVKRIDIATGTITTIIDAVNISSPHMFAFDGVYIYGTNYGDGSVFKIDPTTNLVLGKVAVGNVPDRIIFDGSHLWVSNRGGDSISKIEVDGFTVSKTIALVAGDDPIYFGYDGRYIWCAREGVNNVIRIDPLDDSITHTIAVGIAPRGLCFDGVFIWCNHSGQNYVTKIPVL